MRREAKPDRTKCCQSCLRDDCLYEWLWPLCFQIAIQVESASRWYSPNTPDLILKGTS